MLAPDETTRAMIDMYARPAVERIDGPIDVETLRIAYQFMARSPRSLVLVQVPGRPHNAGNLLHPESALSVEDSLPWLRDAHLKVTGEYSLPHGRRYALLSGQ